MIISIIIPTLDRQERLRHLIESILENTTLPDEILVIEQGDISLTQSVADLFITSGVPIRTFYQKEKSVAVARNRGAHESRGDLLIFLDDDMEIGNAYISVAADHFVTHPKTLGATGSYMYGEPAWTIKRIIGMLFCVYSWHARNIVLPSGSYDYIRGKNLEKLQPIEWLYGGNMIVQKSVFEEGFEFEPEFKRWSFGEDIMFSYRIHKKYPNALMYLPELVVVHLQGTEHKILNTEALRMKIIYRFIFWKCEVWNGSVFRLAAYVWSQIGLTGLEFLQYPSTATLKTATQSYLYLLRHWRSIPAGDSDFNAFIFKKAS